MSTIAAESGLRLEERDRKIQTMGSILVFKGKGLNLSERRSDAYPDVPLRSDICEGLYALVLSNCGAVISSDNQHGLVATFGYPIFYNNDGYNSLKCALEIRNFLRACEDTGRATPVSFGIGVAAGPFGAESKTSGGTKMYAIEGETFDRARRLQEISERSGADLLVDGETQEPLRDFLDSKRVRLRYASHRASPDIFYILNMRAHAPISAILTHAELEATYSNAAGEVEFF